MTAVARARKHSSIHRLATGSCKHESAHKAVLQKVYPLHSLTHGQGCDSWTVWPAYLALSAHFIYFVYYAEFETLGGLTRRGVLHGEKLCEHQRDNLAI
jgi:hypothetical protein